MGVRSESQRQEGDGEGEDAIKLNKPVDGIGQRSQTNRSPAVDVQQVPRFTHKLPTSAEAEEWGVTISSRRAGSRRSSHLLSPCAFCPPPHLTFCDVWHI